LSFGTETFLSSPLCLTSFVLSQTIAASPPMRPPPFCWTVRAPSSFCVRVTEQVCGSFDALPPNNGLSLLFHPRLLHRFGPLFATVERGSSPFADVPVMSFTAFYCGFRLCSSGIGAGSRDFVLVTALCCTLVLFFFPFWSAVFHFAFLFSGRPPFVAVLFVNPLCAPPSETATVPFFFPFLETQSDVPVLTCDRPERSRFYWSYGHFL